MSNPAPSFPTPKGHLIRFFRQRAKKTQEELAEDANLHVKTLRRAEHGQGLTEYTILCISRALGVAPVNFFDQTELEAFLAGRLAKTEYPPDDQLHADPRSKDDTNPDEILDRYDIVPSRYVDLNFEITFEQKETWHSVNVDAAEALGIECGGSVNTGFTVRTTTGQERSYQVYATGALAETILDVPKGHTVRALATTIYATCLSHWQDHSYIELTGLLLIRIFRDA